MSDVLITSEELDNGRRKITSNLQQFVSQTEKKVVKKLIQKSLICSDENLLS